MILVLTQCPQVVLICGPAHVHGIIAANVAPHLSPDTYIGTIFAQGGFDWIVRGSLGSKAMENVAAIFGLQNIPWICKTTVYGSEARILGPKDSLRGACSPPHLTPHVVGIIEDLFDIPTVGLPNFLCLTLTPSTQIIHPAR